jgi:uncharacterized protein (TIGR02145 family)
MKTKIRIWMPAILFALFSVFLTNCTEDATIAEINTNETTELTQTTATSGGVINSDGGATVTACGVCWSTGQTPTISDNKTTDSTATGSFTSAITGLTANTTYYVRAYATNSAGTAYGSAISFKTKGGVSNDTFTDLRDNNVYKTIKIGNQVWMAENLRYLPSVVGPETGPKTSSDLTPYYYVYGYNGTNISEAKATANYSTYGVLYNWPAAASACPEGWHLPSNEEWTELINYLGGERIAGGKLKATTLWSSPNSGATNESGFTALPAGYRKYNGTFNSIENLGFWWSDKENIAGNTWPRILDYTDSDVSSVEIFGVEMGYSVRCVKD